MSLWNRQVLVRARRRRKHSNKRWGMQGFQSAQWGHSGSVGSGGLNKSVGYAEPGLGPGVREDLGNGTHGD